MLALGSLHLHHSGVGCHLVWLAMGSPRHPAVRIAIGGLLRGDWACHVCGPRGRRGGVSAFSPMEVLVTWRGSVEEGGGVLTGQLCH